MRERGLASARAEREGEWSCGCVARGEKNEGTCHGREREEKKDVTEKKGRERVLVGIKYGRKNDDNWYG
jgi:hypothetical protein